MNLKIYSLACIICISGFISPQKVPLTIQDQVNLKYPTSITVSPDGERVAFVIRSADLQKSAWVNQIFIQNTKVDSPIQGNDIKKGKPYSLFSLPGKTATNPKFSPDGKYLTFLADNEYSDTKSTSGTSGSKQLWAATLSGGTPSMVSNLPNGVDEFCFSKSGEVVAFLTERYDSLKENENEANKKLKKDEQVFPKQNAAKTLVLLQFPSGKAIASFNLDAGTAEIEFNPTGTLIVFQSNITGEYNDEQKFDLFTIDVASGRITKLTNAQGPETSPTFSPNAKLLAYKTQTVPDIEFAESDLTIMNLTDFSTVNLTAKFDLSVVSFVWKDDGTLLVLVNEGMTQSVYSVTVTGNTIEKIFPDGGTVSEIVLTKNNTVVARLETATTLPEIYFGNTMITNFSEQLEKFDTGSQEVLHYPAYDNKYKIAGILFKPTGFNDSKKYPLILTCHGGPYGNFKNTFLQGYPIRQLLAQGSLVFSPNPRGSSGYSDEFSQANRYDLGGGDYKDIMTGVDYLVNKGFVDTSKLGVMGGSYGGYMTNWIISQTPRFKAAVSLYGIFSFFTDWSNSWQPIFEKMYFGYYYWERPIDMNNLYVKLSPAFYASKIKTPTLILQGDKDVYTDMTNSKEMYQALNAMNVPVEFILYPREGHGIKGEPNHYINTVERTLSWFNRFLK